MNQKPSITDSELAEYLDDKLSVDERTLLNVRIQSDPDARDMIALVRSVSAGELVAGEVPEQAIRKAISLYQQAGRVPVFDLVLSLARTALTVLSAAADIRISAPEPAPALRKLPRRDASMVVATRKFEAVTAEVNIEKLFSGTCNIAVSVLDNASGRPAQNLRLELLGSGRLLGSDRLRGGAALFEEVGRGNYEIVIQDRNNPLGSITVQIA